MSTNSIAEQLTCCPPMAEEQLSIRLVQTTKDDVPWPNKPSIRYVYGERRYLRVDQ
jgi:hypothetical protein